MAMNIASVKIEGRQRSPAYVTEVARVWRAAIDQCKKILKVLKPNRVG